VAEFNYKPNFYARFRHLLEVNAVDEDGNAADSAIGAKARATLDAISSGDAIKAAYAAFSFGLALSYEMGPKKTREYVDPGRIEQALDYPEDFQKLAVTSFNRVRAVHSDWNLPQVTAEVARLLYDINPRLRHPHKLQDKCNELSNEHPGLDRRRIAEMAQEQVGRIAPRTMNAWRKKYRS
jgi:hypothetical protein